MEATLTKKTSLVDHLVWQLRLSHLSDVEVEAAEGLRICHCSEGVVTEPDGRRAALSRLVAQKTQPAG